MAFRTGRAWSQRKTESQRSWRHLRLTSGPIVGLQLIQAAFQTTIDGRSCKPAFELLVVGRICFRSIQGWRWHIPLHLYGLDERQ
jgi:hypothetical protein